MIKLKKLSSILLSSILLLSTAYAQTDNQRIKAYINQYKSLAISEMLRSGIPASVTLAQGILETAGGQSDLASVANNHFGIKCKNEWTGESVLHNDDAKNECFRKYASVEDSYKDHSDFLKSRPGYAFLFKLDPTDYEGWAKGLKKAGYATSSTYTQQLIRLIVENNLQQYTLMGLQPENSFELLASNNADKEEVEELTEQPLVMEEAKQLNSNHKLKVRESVIQGYPLHATFNINDAKVIFVEAGTSLLAVANNYNVSYKKLLEFNDLDETDILTSNQLIFLQKKQKKGIKEVHVVEENESLHDIAQKEGIQLSIIMEFNGLQKNMQPAAGEKIYLKSPAPSSPRLAMTNKYKASVSMK